MKLRSQRQPSLLPQRLPLTEQNLRTFDGKTITRTSETSFKSSKPDNSESMPSSTDPDFPRWLMSVGIRFEYDHALPPRDLDQLFKGLRKPDPSLPGGILFLQLKSALKSSINEEVFKVHFLRFIFQPSSKELLNGYSMQMEVEWTKVAGTAITTTNLPNPKPDYFEAFLLEQYPNKAIDTLDWRIRPSAWRVAMPTLCVEFKGPEKPTRNVRAQAAYDGAAMVNAAWETHKYMNRPAQSFLGKTQALVIALVDGVFELFACHAMNAHHNSKSTGRYPGSLNYHVFRLVKISFETEDDLKDVCRWIHNAQDWCHAQAEATKKDVQDFFQVEESDSEQSFAEERRENDNKRAATDTKRKSSRFEQGRAAKRRKFGIARLWVHKGG